MTTAFTPSLYGPKIDAQLGESATDYIVTLKPGANQNGLLRAIEAISGRFEKSILDQSSVLSENGSIIITFSVPEGAIIDKVLKFVQKHAGVEHVEQDVIVSTALASADSLYVNGSLWGMSGPSESGTGFYEGTFGSRADAAWTNPEVVKDGAVGAMTTVIGVIDTGIDALHPDLYKNIWINQNEIPNIPVTDVDGDNMITFHDLNAKTIFGSYINPVQDINGNGYVDADDVLRDARWADGVDTDQNGFVDDFFGWDFVDDDNRPFEAYLGYNGVTGNIASNSYHGTHVAGTIGASANDEGVVGVSWDVSLMPLRFLGENGSGVISDAISAVNYYATLGRAHSDLDFVATNNSWGGPGSSLTLQNAIQAAGNNGHLFVAAAGNASQDNDVSGSFPGNYDITSTYNGKAFDPVISVASIDGNGALSSFSNYGAINVDLGAPGRSVMSTLAGTEVYGQYGYMGLNGTSMATPHVTGALALLASEFPNMSPDQLREHLLSSTAETSSLVGKTVTGGRLDVAAMIPNAPIATLQPQPDVFQVSESAGFGVTDINVLNNDGPGIVAAVSGLAANLGLPVSGSNGGQFILQADGRLDFSANGDFESLGIGETATTSISYTALADLGLDALLPVLDPKSGVDIAVKDVIPSTVLPASGRFIATAEMSGGLNDGRITIIDTQDATLSDDNAGGELAKSSGSVGSRMWSDISTDNEAQWVVQAPDGSQITIMQIEVEGTVGTYFWGATGELTTGVEYTVLSRDTNPSAQNGVSYKDMILASSADQSATVTVTVTGLNDAPVVSGENFMTTTGVSLSNIDVLSNDTDIDGDALSVLSATAANGVVAINADGTLNYTPNTGYSGTDTIQYGVSDGFAPAVTGLANVVVIDNGPSIDPKQGVTIGVKDFAPSTILPSKGVFVARANVAGALSDGQITITDMQDSTLSDDNAGNERAISSGSVGGQNWSGISTDNEAQWVLTDPSGHQITVMQIEVEGAVGDYFWGATGELVDGVAYTVTSRNTNPNAEQGVSYADMLGPVEIEATHIGVKAIAPSAFLPGSGSFTATADISGALSDGYIAITDTQDTTLSDDNAGAEIATSSGAVGGLIWSDITTDNEAQWLIADSTGHQITVFQIEVEGSVGQYFWGATDTLVEGAQYSVLSRNTNPNADQGVSYDDMMAASLELIGISDGGSNFL